MGPDHIQRLPAFVPEKLETMRKTTPQRDTLLLGKPLPFGSNGQLCLEQIWGRELKAPGSRGPGQREQAPYILWQRGCTLRNYPDQVAKALYWKNETLRPPLKPAEVENIIQGGGAGQATEPARSGRLSVHS